MTPTDPKVNGSLTQCGWNCDPVCVNRPEWKIMHGNGVDVFMYVCQKHVKDVMDNIKEGTGRFPEVRRINPTYDPEV